EDVNFRNVVVVMTSNMGMKELEASMSSIGFNSDRATGRKPSAVEVEASVHKAYRQKSSPEFRNRIDMLVVYEGLSATQLSDIINLEIIQVQKRVMAMAPDRLFVLKASEGARDFLLKRAIASEDGGLANLKRQLNESLLEPLGTALNLGLVKMGDLVEIDVENGELVFDVLSGGMEVDAFSRIPILGQGEVDLSTTEARQTFFSPAHVSLAPGMPLSGYATIGGALLNLSELMFLQRAVELKALARFQSPFLADYELRLSDKDDLDRLTGRAFSLVRDLTDLMGVKVLASETTYQPPFSVSLRVRALPGQIDLLRLRYSEISIELIN
ncbi:MAG TPA: AAA family ATPase, partial [Candidatus Melainabacteria bacterium]|nr:AAA family ATPase [Candidatus Melainabacteria bacterium]